MLPAFLLPETVVHANGKGEPMVVDSVSGLLITLGILSVVEQESLDVSLWASLDGENWEAKPLSAFPQKFYPGIHQLYLDFTQTPRPQKIAAHWHVNRWGRGEMKPMFRFYVFAEPA